MKSFVAAWSTSEGVEQGRLDWPPCLARQKAATTAAKT